MTKIEDALFEDVNKIHWIALTHLRVMMLENAKNFLQNILTCDLNAIQNNSIALVCDPKGRVLVSLRIYPQGENYGVLVHEKSQPILSSIFAKYQKLYRSLKIFTLDFSIVGMIADEHESPQLDGRCVELPTVAHKKRAIYLGSSIEAQSNLALWKYYDMQSLFPTIMPESSGKHVANVLYPLSSQAYSLSKGCYIGQEVISKIHFLSEKKNQTVLMNSLEEQSIQSKLKDSEGRLMGWVLDSVFYQDQYHFLFLKV